MDYYDDLRIAFCLNFCKRWYFIFDGVECNGPLAIDGLVHIASNQGRKDSHIHRVQIIGGYCQGISARTVQVEINVQPCGNYPGLTHIPGRTPWCGSCARRSLLIRSSSSSTERNIKTPDLPWAPEAFQRYSWARQNVVSKLLSIFFL